MSIFDLNSIRNRVIDMSDTAIDLATQASQVASGVAKNAGDMATGTAIKVGEAVVDAANSVGNSIVSGAETTKSKVSEWSADSREFIVRKIKRLSAIVDYDKTIAEVKRVGAEKNISVEGLVDFLTKLKDFSNDGK